MDDEFFITGKKEIKSSKINIQNSTAAFTIDKDAKYIYYSKPGGFLPPEQCADSILTNPLHYGAGLFEGMRFYYSPYGTVLVEPWENIGRMMHSATFFNPILATEIKKIFDNERDVEEVRLEPIYPRLYYRRCARAYDEERNPIIELEVIKKINGKRVVEKRPVELKLRAMHNDNIREYSMAELDAIIKVLAFTNRLVSIDYFPGTLDMVPAGYIRPFAWVSGEKGLKVPTVLKTKEGFDIKPLYLAVATLPWGVYLNEDDYNRGLDVLVAPYQRIGKDMPSDAKIAGNYVNSTININLGVMFGYGEILALNSSKKVIEGSADRIREQGGLVYMPHMYDTTRKGCGGAYADLADIIEVFNGRCFDRFNELAKETAIRLRKPMAAGSDSHFLFEFGQTYTEIGDFDRDNPKQLLKALEKASIFGKSAPFYVRGPTWLLSKTRKVLRKIGLTK